MSAAHRVAYHPNIAEDKPLCSEGAANCPASVRQNCGPSTVSWDSLGIHTITGRVVRQLHSGCDRISLLDLGSVRGGMSPNMKLGKPGGWLQGWLQESSGRLFVRSACLGVISFAWWRDDQSLDLGLSLVGKCASVVLALMLFVLAIRRALVERRFGSDSS
jgi:hypothetical protein